MTEARSDHLLLKFDVIAERRVVGQGTQMFRETPTPTRRLVLEEIRSLAVRNGGKPPGKGMFARASGITEAKWSGVFWARWSDALLEAGFTPNTLQGRFDSSLVLLKVADLCREFGRLPTMAELKLQRRTDPTFPSKGAVASHFPTKTDLIAALRKLAPTDGHGDLLALLPHDTAPPEEVRSTVAEGFVYLLKSGDHYKIGRSDDLERRIREVRVALPEAVTLVHSIRTDDAPGIEAYWHRRFAERRANGEWFRLMADDARAFKRRTFQ